MILYLVKELAITVQYRQKLSYSPAEYGNSSGRQIGYICKEII